MKENHNRGPFIPQIIAILMLLWALNPENPYGYYVLLRIVLCAICAFLAFRAHAIGNDKWVWVLGVTAAIYNPILRIHLTREIWSVVNIATVVVLAITFGTLRKRSLPEQKGDQTDER
jgi:uncharacterized membrane protein YhaH (DUF805 family)